MKIDFKQARAKLFFSGRNFIALFAGLLFIGLSYSLCYAPTKIDHTPVKVSGKTDHNPAKMSDSELSDIDAQAFFKIEHFSSGNDFWATPTGPATWTVGIPSGSTVSDSYNTGSQNVIRISLGVDLEVHGQIDAAKMGYHEGLQEASTTTSWDLDQTYTWAGDRPAGGYGTAGEGSGPLKLNGMYMDFGFDNIANATTRQLNYIEIGTMSANGNITQTINQINGFVMEGGTGQNDGVMLRQTASGTRVVNFNNEVLGFVFAAKYHYEDHQGEGTDVTGIFQKLPSYKTDDDLIRP